jgi:uncharacterized protein (DUF1330 family)
MPVIMIATQRVKDWDLLAEYRKGAGPVVRRHGGELIGRSNTPECLHGEATDSVVVFRFPDRAAVDAWLADPDYQPLKRIRDQAVDMNLLLIDAM